MRIRVSCAMARIFRTPRKPKSPIARIATVVVPIRRLLERIFIGKPVRWMVESVRLSVRCRLYGQSETGERPIPEVSGPRPFLGAGARQRPDARIVGGKFG